MLLALGLGVWITRRQHAAAVRASLAEVRALSVPTATPSPTPIVPTPTATPTVPQTFVDRPAPKLAAVTPSWLSRKARRPKYSCSAYRNHPWLLFHPAWTHPLPDDETLLTKIVDDPEHKLEKPFRVPGYLRERVLFWMRVHTNYTREMRLMTDRHDLSLIYGYIDFQPLYGACGPRARTKPLEKAIAKELRTKLVQAAKPATKKHARTEEELALRELLSKHGALSPAKALALGRGLRTQTGQRDEFLSALDRSHDLLPQLEAIFRRHGLPVALARIPFVESSFNWKAHSKVGAIGIWQFMPRTAHHILGRINRSQWTDPLLQSEAATEVLADFHKSLKDWSLAVTAYNSGQGRLHRLAHLKHATNLEPLLAPGKKHQALGFAGRNFFAQFLSANLVEAYQGPLFRESPSTPLAQAPSPTPTDASEQRVPAGK